MFDRGTGARVAASAVGALLIAAAIPNTAQAAQASPGDSSAQTTAMSALSLIPWYTAPSLVALRREIDSLWPNRSRVSDGVIGDYLHARTINSHNPVGAANGPRVGTRGAVHAMDITSAGVDVNRVLAALIGDPRIWYVIHDGKIWSRTTGWASRPTTGDPHMTHIHVNLREDSQSAATSAENSTVPWFSGKATTAPALLTSPGSSVSLTPAQVKVLQKALIARGFGIPAGPTGVYGAQTTQAVAAFQRAQGWSGSEADGAAGPETLRRLGVDVTSAANASYTTPSAGTTNQAAKTSTRSKKSGAANPAGLSRAKTKKLQRALIARGFGIPAGPTGVYGAQTTRAVAAFQRAQGWKGSAADGIAGAQTLGRLGVKKSAAKPAATATPAPAAAAPTSSAGTTWDPDNGRLVYDLQGALIARGYSIPAGQTGYFGTRTAAAVKAFQRSLGWRGKQADGIPGPQTLARLGL